MARDGRKGFAYFRWEISEAFRKDPQAMWFSIVALFLGIGPGWTFLSNWRMLRYDPATAVLTATLIALIWTANYSYKAVKHSREQAAADASERSAERERRALALRASRKALLAGLKAELEYLETWLKSASDYLVLLRFNRLPRPMIIEAQRNTHLLTEFEVAGVSAIGVIVYAAELDLEKLAEFLSRTHKNYLDLNVAQIEKLAPNQVKVLRAEVERAQKTVSDVKTIFAKSAEREL